MRTLFTVALSALFLTGCASVPMAPNPLALADRSAVHVEQVSVHWTLTPSDNKHKGRNVFPEEEKPEVAADIESQVRKEFSAAPAGPEAVLLRIDIKDYSGMCGHGTDGCTTAIDADVHVIRLSDHKELAVYGDVMGVSYWGTGIGAKIVGLSSPHRVHAEVASDFAQQLRAHFDGE